MLTFVRKTQDKSFILICDWWVGVYLYQVWLGTSDRLSHALIEKQSGEPFRGQMIRDVNGKDRNSSRKKV